MFVQDQGLLSNKELLKSKWCEDYFIGKEVLSIPNVDLITFEYYYIIIYNQKFRMSVLLRAHLKL